MQGPCPSGARVVDPAVAYRRRSNLPRQICDRWTDFHDTDAQLEREFKSTGIQRMLRIDAKDKIVPLATVVAMNRRWVGRLLRWDRILLRLRLGYPQTQPGRLPGTVNCLQTLLLPGFFSGGLQNRSFPGPARFQGPACAPAIRCRASRTTPCCGFCLLLPYAGGRCLQS